MKRVYILLIVVLLVVPQMVSAEKSKQDKINVALSTVYKGDTIPSFDLYEVTIYGRRYYTNVRKQRKYDKLVHNVMKTYPLAKEVKAILVETYLYLQTLPTDEAKQKHIDQVEKGVWDQYLPEMKKLTLSQGKLLIKLIDRECNQTGFELINAFMGGFKANFYQVFASLFGATLKKEYDPQSIEEDAVIEEIIYLIDHDML
ncbi:MAG: DUF4294 domain-containing protein [Bacteroidaceae bacterium]|jgi:hypothetical protein|nr:DUF4294 domain-containing protein [Bacteroidaceae bacterium]